MWLKFTKDWEWRIPDAKSPTFQIYKAGQVVFTRKSCGEAALAASVAEPTERPENVPEEEVVEIVEADHETSSDEHLTVIDAA